MSRVKDLLSTLQDLWKELRIYSPEERASKLAWVVSYLSNVDFQINEINSQDAIDKAQRIQHIDTNYQEIYNLVKSIVNGQENDIDEATLGNAVRLIDDSKERFSKVESLTSSERGRYEAPNYAHDANARYDIDLHTQLILLYNICNRLSQSPIRLKGMQDIDYWLHCLESALQLVSGKTASEYSRDYRGDLVCDYNTKPGSIAYSLVLEEKLRSLLIELNKEVKKEEELKNESRRQEQAEQAMDSSQDNIQSSGYTPKENNDILQQTWDEVEKAFRMSKVPSLRILKLREEFENIFKAPIEEYKAHRKSGEEVRAELIAWSKDAIEKYSFKTQAGFSNAINDALANSENDISGANKSVSVKKGRKISWQELKNDSLIGHGKVKPRVERIVNGEKYVQYELRYSDAAWKKFYGEEHGNKRDCIFSIITDKEVTYYVTKEELLAMRQSGKLIEGISSISHFNIIEDRDFERSPFE